MNKISINFKDTIVMCDFEKALRASITKVFKGLRLKGCYFHYVKCLWHNAKKFGLTRKNIISTTKIIIFILKLLTLVKPENHLNIINSIKEYISNMETNSKLFKAYYERVWLNTDFIKFDLQYDRTIKSRTNNVCEGFHSYLNRLIEVNHPKQALFVDKRMQITKMNYDKYIDKILSSNIENINCVNIYKECYKYFLAYLKEYKKALDFNDFLKNCNSESDNYNVICNNIINLLFDMDLGIDKENNLFEDDSKHYEDYKEEDSEQIINIEELSISDTLNKINIDDCKGLFEDSLDAIPKKRKVSYNEKKNI